MPFDLWMKMQDECPSAYLILSEESHGSAAHDHRAKSIDSKINSYV